MVPLKEHHGLTLCCFLQQFHDFVLWKRTNIHIQLPNLLITYSIFQTIENVVKDRPPRNTTTTFII